MTHPYKALPDYAYWRRAFAGVPQAEVDPVIKGDIEITPQVRVATAGSCFAQHISRYLQRNGLYFFVTETSHPLYGTQFSRQSHYSIFPARFGNVYTARQLLQLYKRAFEDLTPVEDIWREPNGTCIDPYRPQIQPGGFSSEEEYWGDRRWHMKCLREMFSRLDVFIFTFGLTEAWRNRRDGCVFPLCPGVAGGVFNPDHHEFYNQTFEDVVADMSEFISLLRTINKSAKLILTVSPVPLAATKEDRHVLVSTVYSKSVLRVAAQRLVDTFDGVSYFPSFEIITGTFNRGEYYSEDFRDVTLKGVSHVMKLFFKHYVRGSGTATEDVGLEAPEHSGAMGLSFDKRAGDWLQLLCDEELLDRNVGLDR